MPALLTSTSRRSDSIDRLTSSTSPWSVTSRRIHSIRSWSGSPAPAGSRAPASTLKPWPEASWRAISRPIPRLAPLTSATSSGLMALQQLLPDHHALDLGGALADQQQGRVSVEALDLVL